MGNNLIQKYRFKQLLVELSNQKLKKEENLNIPLIFNLYLLI